MASSFMNVMLNGFLTIVSYVVNASTAGVSATLTTLLPSFSTLIDDITNFVNGSVLNGVVYFFNIFPPHFKNILVFYLELLTIFFAVYIVYCAVVLIIHLISKITDILT